MPHVVWKATLQMIDVQSIEVPELAEMLCAREQHGQIAVWFRCDPDARRTRRRIAVCGTGHPAPDPAFWRHIGTASLSGGSLIFHVFEEAPSS